MSDDAATTQPDHVVDFVVVGSGGGLCGAIAAHSTGAEVLVVEKQANVGGSTGLSGGVIWLPDNPLMQREGVPDSVEEGMAHLADVVGDIGPASSIARRRRYIVAGHEMVGFLEREGLEFRRCEGYADYYSEAAGGKPRSRSIEVRWFDGNQLGPWLGKLRRGFRGFAMYCRDGGELSKPGSLIVDATGARFMNEALPYMEAGQQIYARNLEVPSVPCWLIMDTRHRRRYPFGLNPPGHTPAEWLRSGYLRKADTLAELAQQCGIDAAGLERTVARFNEFAVDGVDRDFHRGEGAYQVYCGDRTNKPNACLGPVDKPPYWAVAIYPGDIGTSGGLLCDEYSRVLRPDGNPIPGLYAAGNTTASVMGRTYPGAGASIGASLIFSYVAAQHATGPRQTPRSEAH